MTSADAFDIVRRSRANGRLPHAYLVIGDPRKEGLDFARRVAALLLCKNEAKAPCGTCDDCRRVASGGHPDILVVEPEKKSRVIGIEAVREKFLPWVAQSSYSGGWKVAMMLSADRMNDSSGNAILKTLEEPPEATLLLLVTDRPDALLATVRSRCQLLNLSTGRRPPDEPWRTRTAEILAKHSNSAQLHASATAARFQAMFDEISDLAESQIRTEKSQTADDPNAPEMDKDTLAALIGVRERELRLSIFISIQDWYRDLLALSLDKNASLCYEEFRETLEEKAAKVKTRLALRYIESVEKIRTLFEDRNIRPVSTVLSYYFAFLP